ncbi:aspartyl-phosphate phosphatase Spo0E family protein [Bacillus sp. EB600]|uniref:aspartyl-phosphate phosphatase Spo0E family protein n=1 Tax=Bacillus sp. EB600 TaxID=2806345 RepID=UPI002108B931|nr:aspartyl-phosphate phosphatase Spo0E family protein [Bacillus sp. EB600]MCQ6281751.1 aspartyl-phosphate phosphatase Spo0E family protein [Bacillus sp. EB600]
MIFIELDEIEYRINQLKKELIQIAEITGLNSRETIYCSQKLDQLITIHQKSSYKENRNMLLNGNKAV